MVTIQKNQFKFLTSQKMRSKPNPLSERQTLGWEVCLIGKAEGRIRDGMLKSVGLLGSLR